MTESQTCPDCGHRNPPGSTTCEACHFPLDDAHHVSPKAESGGVPIRPMRPIRPRRPRPDNMSLTLWLVFGGVSVLILLFVAIQANVERARPPVEGTNADQQKRVDELTAELERDSTNVDAHNALADILYDTGNWSHAIGHYRAVLKRDSSRVGAIVDLGVCYYNLGDVAEAERLFLLGLTRDPHHPIALFNLGIVSERQDKLDQALQYYHRALESAPPEPMRQPLLEALKRVQQRTGKAAPPIPEGGSAR
jgi:tetratricopeptide (TPR) repeat protein